MPTQIRMEVSKQVNAKVHYIAKSLGIPVSKTYELIVISSLVDHDLDILVERLKPYANQFGYTTEPTGSATGPARD